MNTLKKISIILVLLMGVISFSSATFADNHDWDPQQGGGFEQQQGAPNTDTSIKLVNPLGNNTTVKTLPDLVQQILKIVLTVGTPLVAIAIIYTGFQFVAAQGNPEALTKAKKSFLMVIIGAAILLGAYVIAEAIVGTINAIRG